MVLHSIDCPHIWRICFFSNISLVVSTILGVMGQKCSCLSYVCLLKLYLMVLLVGPSIFISRSLFYRVTMEVLCQLLKSVERFQLLFIYPGTSLATTVLRSIGSDYGRPGSWCWIQQGSMAKACDLLVLFMSFSIDYCTSISCVVCVT